MNKMVNKLWTRIFIVAAAVLLLLFFSNDFGLIDIQETAIVVALGIDAAQEGEGYDVTAQIAVPASTGTSSAGNVTVKGVPTVGEAVAELNHETGWYPTLVHCRLILLGEEVANEDVFNVLDYFLRNDAVEDSCLVAACKGKARETFQAQSPVGDISASAITKVLSSEAQATGIVTVTILKNFAVGYYSESESGFLPCITVKQEADSQGGQNADGAFAPAGAFGKENAPYALSLAPSIKRNKWWRAKKRPLPIAAPVSAEGGNQGSGGQGGSGKSGSGSSADVFHASETMLFYKGKRVALLTPEETLAYNLAATDTDYAYGSVDVSENGEQTSYNLKMKISKKKRKLTFENGMPVFTFTIRANARIADTDKSQPIIDVAKTLLVNETILRAAEEKFQSELASVWQKATNAGCDLFFLKEKLHRFHYKRYAEFKDGVPEIVQVRYDIKFTSMK